jgi:hypothetical protein
MAWRGVALRGAAWLAEAVSAPPCCATRCMALCTSVPVPLWLGAQLSRLPLVSRRATHCYCSCMRVLHHHADTNGFFIALFEKVGRHRAAADRLSTHEVSLRKANRNRHSAYSHGRWGSVAR